VFLLHDTTATKQQEEGFSSMRKIIIAALSVCLVQAVRAQIPARGAGTGGSTTFAAASQSEAEAGTNNTNGMTPLRTAQALAVRGLLDLGACGYSVSGAVLTVFPNASATRPCTVGSRPWQFTAPATVTISGTTSTGSGYVYLTNAGSLIFAHNVASTFTPSAGIAVAASTNAWPSGVARLFTPTWTSSVWDAYSANRDLRSSLANNTSLVCTGCTAQSTDADGNFSFTVPTTSSEMTLLARFGPGTPNLSHTAATNVLSTPTYTASGVSFGAGTLTISRSLISVGDMIRCRHVVRREQVGGGSDSGLSLNLISLADGTSVQGGLSALATNSAANLMFVANLDVQVESTTRQNTHSIGFNTSIGLVVGNNTAGSTPWRTVDLSTTDFTIGFQTQMVSRTDDTHTYLGGACWLTKGMF
jgi:hypothetical protein